MLPAVSPLRSAFNEYTIADLIAPYRGSLRRDCAVNVSARRTRFRMA